MRTSDWIVRMAAVLYAMTCVAIIIIYDKQDTTEPTMQEIVNTTQQPTDAVIYWVNQTEKSVNATNPAEIEVSDSIAIDGSLLSTLLDEKNYIEQGENVATGMYFPVAILKYSTQGIEHTLVFSFMNAEVKVYAGNEFVKSKLMYDAVKLHALFDSL